MRFKKTGTDKTRRQKGVSYAKARKISKKKPDERGVGLSKRVGGKNRSNYGEGFKTKVRGTPGKKNARPR